MMASSTEKHCIKCSKGLGQALCGGCDRWFCVKHLNEHRQELNQEMDHLTVEHDQLQQNLLHNDDDRHHSLLTRIDRWESKAIEKIKQVANNIRQELKDSMEQSKKSIEDSLRQITRELQENRQSEAFTEIHLIEWTSQLKALTEEFTKPSMIDIKHDEDEASSTHLPLIRLKMTKKNKVGEQITNSTKWSTNGHTVAGGHGQGYAVNQLNDPYGLDVDDDGTLFITDMDNHRIIRWKPKATEGEIVIGSRGKGNQTDQLHHPVAVLIDRKNECLIVSEDGNRRVTRWSLDRNTAKKDEGQVIISNIQSLGLAMDKEGSLYVSDFRKHQVRRYRSYDEKHGVVVAGGHGRGSALNQLDHPRHIFVDDDYSIYISDRNNHRVMKWVKDAKEGVVVAGGPDRKKSLEQLSGPSGIFVDCLGSVYVADQWNHRVMRWLKDAKEGEVIVGGNGQGSQNNQLDQPKSISFDNHGNLYVIDRSNNRIQCFDRQLVCEKNPNEATGL